MPKTPVHQICFSRHVRMPIGQPANSVNAEFAKLVDQVDRRVDRRKTTLPTKVRRTRARCRVGLARERKLLQVRIARAGRAALSLHGAARDRCRTPRPPTGIKHSAGSERGPERRTARAAGGPARALARAHAAEKKRGCSAICIHVCVCMCVCVCVCVCDMHPVCGGFITNIL